MALFIATLICALFGFIWDVSLHIGKGRDPGPLANPAHYFILFGLFLLFVAGCAAIILPYEKPGPFAVRITKHWYAPVGGFLMAGCGLYALTGFPLDDVWHRIFGQDVTLWGPTHLMMIGGAGFATISALLLEYEGDRAMGDDKPKDGIFLKFVQYLGFGGIIIGLSVFQIEFDFGVPQFRQVFEPMLIAAAARVRPRRGAHHARPRRRDHRRAVRDRAARRRRADRRPGARRADQLVRAVPRRRRSSSNWSRSPRCSSGPSSSALVSGLGVGTVGLWLESFWIDAVYHYPWPTSIWPEALTMAVPVTILIGACGAMLGMVLTGQTAAAPRHRHRAGGAHRARHRRRGRQRTALRRPEERHRHNDLDRGAQLGRQAHGHRRRADQSARPDQRRPELGVGPRLAGRHWRTSAASSSTIWRSSGPATTAQRNPCRFGASGRRCCGVHDGRPWPRCRSSSPATRHRRAGGARRGVDDAAVRPRDHHPAARAQPGHPMVLWTVGCVVVLVCTLIMIGGLTWGAGRINRREPTDIEAELQPSAQA